MGEPREGATAHAETYPDGANTALRVFGADLSMAAAVPDGRPDPLPHLVREAGRHARRRCCRTSRTWSRAHSLEPHRPWKAEQLAGGYRLSSWAERTAFEAADAVIAVSAGMRTDTLDSYRDLDPDEGARGAERHRPRRVHAGHGHRRGRPGWASTWTSRPSSSSAGSPGRRASSTWSEPPSSSIPTPSCVLLAGAPDTPEIAQQIGDAFAAVCSRVARQRDLGRADAAAGAGPPGPVARHGVRLPVGVRAARHRQPRGDGLRDRRRRVRGRRHPRGGGGRRDRLPGAVRPGAGRRPGRGRGVRGSSLADQDQRADPRTGIARRRSAWPGGSAASTSSAGPRSRPRPSTSTGRRSRRTRAEPRTCRIFSERGSSFGGGHGRSLIVAGR